MRAKVPGDTPQGRPPGRLRPANGRNHHDRSSTTRSCIPAASPIWVVITSRPGGSSALVPPGRLVVATQGAEELVERSAQRVSQGVPRLQGADRAPLLDLDESPSGQSASGSEFVVRPTARRPQLSEFQAQCLEVGVGREDRHQTIRRCRHLPCQCRPLPYFTCRRYDNQGRGLHYRVRPTPALPWLAQSTTGGRLAPWSSAQPIQESCVPGWWNFARSPAGRYSYANSAPTANARSAVQPLGRRSWSTWPCMPGATRSPHTCGRASATNEAAAGTPAIVAAMARSGSSWPASRGDASGDLPVGGSPSAVVQAALVSSMRNHSCG
jgi:hypothetical protein